MNYDTLIIILTNEYDPSVDFLQTFMPELEITLEGLKYGILTREGKLRNLKVTIKKSSIKIEGSIHVFYKGNNLEAMTFSEFVKAIDLLKSKVNLPIYNARISRLDFSGNILLKHPVEAYLAYFGQKSRFKKQVYDSGVLYTSEAKTLVFYNKIACMKHKKEKVPDCFQNKNVLRFEVRFNRKLYKSLNQQTPTLEHLCDPNFFITLCQLWLDEYRSVTMEMSSPSGLVPTGSKPKIIEQLASLQINQIGTDKLLAEINTWQKNNDISKKEAYRIRKYLCDTTNQKNSTIENELINELSSKIEGMTDEIISEMMF